MTKEEFIKAMLKPLYITFDNGEIYVTDGHFVADHAAKYYATNDPKYPDSSYEENYEYEYKWMLSDTDLMSEHMRNEMDWEDLNTIYYGKREYSYGDEFIYAMVDDVVDCDIEI